MTEAPIRVVVADDQRVVREGLQTLLGLLDGIDVVAVAGDGETAVEAAQATVADVVLMDLNMPRVDGVEATRRLKAVSPGTRVLVLTTLCGRRSSVPGTARRRARLPD